MDKKLANARQTKLLWVDLEMTGLNPKKDKILEIAAIVTDWNFNELATYEAVIHHKERVLKKMDPWCIKQHGASGLTDKVRESKITSHQVEVELLAFINKNFSPKLPVLLAGNSIHFDRQFIVEHWSKVNQRLHYRMLDVTAWKVVFEGKYRHKFTNKAEDHRALNDIRGSIEELKYYLGKVKAAKK